jgi:hypothetical protein
MAELQRPPVELVDQAEGAGHWFLTLWENINKLRSTIGVWTSGTVQTVGAVTETLCSITTGTSRGYLLIGFAVCSRDTYVFPETVGARIIAAVGINSGGVSGYLSQSTVYNGFAYYPALDLDFYITTTDAVISLNVLGIAGETINWKGGILALESV